MASGAVAMLAFAFLAMSLVYFWRTAGISFRPVLNFSYLAIAFSPSGRIVLLMLLGQPLPYC